MNSQPSEIIDADHLHYSEDNLKQMLKFVSDRFLVLSVYGSRNSGKTTLLNILLGLNFTKSQIKITKGVYGTVFKFNDERIADFDGIFVLDMEGLSSDAKD